MFQSDIQDAMAGVVELKLLLYATVMITCEHLRPIEVSAREAGLKIEASGDWWGNSSTQNIYFACALNKAALVKEYILPDFIEWYEWDGRVAGHEAGFHCKRCDSLLVGSLNLYEKRIWPV